MRTLKNVKQHAEAHIQALRLSKGHRVRVLAGTGTEKSSARARVNESVIQKTV